MAYGGANRHDDWEALEMCGRMGTINCWYILLHFSTSPYSFTSFGVQVAEFNAGFYGNN